MSGGGPSGWQGPLRAAAAIFLAGFLVVWLVKPIGNPCPDLARLPPGSTASSTPSFAPPGSRTCTYSAAGTQATAKYVPWLDWIVLLLLAAVAGGAVRAFSPAGRAARDRAPVAAPRPARPERPEPAERPAPAERPSRASRDPSPGRATARDPAERERARQERAARDRGRRRR